ncbi:hypothetical protein [Acidisoma sp.]|uniref:hypothetical protein n=1 Tax=Acidisoma sp. TaxID=1872115 RepID=UPI003AFF62E8
MFDNKRAMEAELAKGRDKGGREAKKPKANKKAAPAESSPFKQPPAPPVKGAGKKA